MGAAQLESACLAFRNPRVQAPGHDGTCQQYQHSGEDGEKSRREGKERKEGEEEELTEPKKKIKQGWRERTNSCFCH